MTVKYCLEESLWQLLEFEEFKLCQELPDSLVPRILCGRELAIREGTLKAHLSKETQPPSALLPALEVLAALKAFYEDAIELLVDKAQIRTAVERLHALSALYDGAVKIYSED